MSQPNNHLTVSQSTPAFEGVNIRTWVGFKHFIYLVERALLDWLRDQGTPARSLFHDHGLGVEITDLSVQLPAVLELDDTVRTEICPASGRSLRVTMRVDRDGEETVVLKGKVSLALTPESAAEQHREPPSALQQYLVGDLGSASQPVTASDLPPSPLWTWRAAYPLCHYTDRVQHSAFVRALEEVVDRFLHERGIGVARLLRERSWIPVVSRVSVTLHAPVHMDEMVHTDFVVDDVLRRVMFDGRMTCWVERDGHQVVAATARILHGYAVSAGPDAGNLAEFDDEVIAALQGTGS